ncbi:MAG TPA: ATP-binding protein [Syntrophorhabdales bacterium]|nr:ATP-binding protein [Syntrophorhabdales bacterium]
MGDKRTLLFPLSLFAIFFVLIAFTGFFQIRIIKENIEGILQAEGDILSKSIQQEIDRNIEYLNLLGKSPAIITPVYLNMLSYDEAIVDDLYDELSKLSLADIDRIRYRHVLVTNEKGRAIERKGSISVAPSYLEELLKKDERTVLKMPSDKDQTLLIGVKAKDRLVFVNLDEEELEGLRKKAIVEAVLETEGKRLNVSGIAVFDPKGALYLGLKPKAGKAYKIVKPLSARYFPDYTLEIRMSSNVVRDTLRRTTLSFIALLFMLLVGGAAGIYIIFRLEQKAAGKLKEMERQMELKERLISLGKLASGMAHEIRNPLNAMSMSIQRLKREFVPAAEKKDEYYKFIDIVRAELTRVNQLVEEFLLSTKSHAPMEDEKLRTIVEEVAIILGERANAKGIRIINQVDGALVVRCQKERLKQAFHNLVLNSIEAIGKDGAVTVSSQLDGLSAHVIIKDTGPGIKKEALSKVFEYHYTTKDKGMGLGLPISFTIIKDHGGDLHVTSDEGKGATFIITLPMKR